MRGGCESGKAGSTLNALERMAAPGRICSTPRLQREDMLMSWNGDGGAAASCPTILALWLPARSTSSLSDGHMQTAYRFLRVAIGCHLVMAQWPRSRNCPWSDNTCYGAARGGHDDVLHWLRSSDCQWGEDTCYGAAGGGHCALLQWARATGCPWDQRTCYAAAEGGHLNVLQ